VHIPQPDGFVLSFVDVYSPFCAGEANYMQSTLQAQASGHLFQAQMWISQRRFYA
jgi:hypothetical protein